VAELPVILIIDDDPHTEALFRVWFRRKYVTIVKPSLIEGKNVLDSMDVDAVVLDYYVEDGFGPALLPFIEEGVLTVFLTGDSTAFLKNKDRFDVAFMKPYDMADLEAILDNRLL
jgi:DNA-binding NtrC family response regulator